MRKKSSSPIRRSRLRGEQKKSAMDRELAYVYGEEERIDFSHLIHRRTRTWSRRLTRACVLLLCLSLFLWGAYFYFGKTLTHPSTTFELAIDGPENIVSGETTNFVVRYKNPLTHPIASLEISLHIPKGFAGTMTPAPTESHEQTHLFRLGTLEPLAEGTMVLNGPWLMRVPSVETLQAQANFRPSNFNADFQEIFTKTIRVDSSILELKIEGPTSAVPGEEIEYVFSPTIKEGATMANTLLRLDLPETFFIQETDPKTAELTTEWPLLFDDPLTPPIVRVKGSFTADASGVYPLTATLEIKSGDEFLEQRKALWNTDVLGSGLLVRLIVNGATDDLAVDPGATMRLSLDVANKDEKKINGLTVALYVISEKGVVPIDFDHAELAEGTWVADDLISWDANALGHEGSLSIGERETIDFLLPLKEEVVADHFSLQAVATVKMIGGIKAERILSSTPLTVFINSDTDLSHAVHLDLVDPTAETGTLPPTVGETTRLGVAWSIENSLHPLDDIEVQTTIPPGIDWVGAALLDMGELHFDPASRLLTWKIARLPLSTPQAAASFDLAMTPTEEDRETFIKLTNGVKLTATDATTTYRITKELDPLTTEFVQDADGNPRGVVVSPGE
jgi:hypothetical protein